MYLKKGILYLIAETPIHAGSGSELGIVDLPIQREKYTDYPKIEASGLKGCLREAFESANKEIELNGKKIRPKDELIYKKDGTEKKTTYLSLVFGPEDEEISHASAIALTDAKILLFPVKSLRGIFAWVTCPLVLERFKKDLKIAGRDLNNFSDLDTLENTIPEQTNIVVDSKVVLEEFTFEVKENKTTTKIAEFLAEQIFPNEDAYKFWKEKLKKDLVILSNDDFKHFVKTSTEIITRTKINSSTGTVQHGALWTEEYLPQDSILYSIVMFSPLRVEEENLKGDLKGDTPMKEAENVVESSKMGFHQ